MAENRVVGIGFWGVLALMLIGFKITGYIDWSWMWVLAPLWAPWALAFAIVGVLLLLSIVMDWDR